jgi:hypothetical protein
MRHAVPRLRPPIWGFSGHLPIPDGYSDAYRPRVSKGLEMLRRLKAPRFVRAAPLPSMDDEARPCYFAHKDRYSPA